MHASTRITAALVCVGFAGCAAPATEQPPVDQPAGKLEEPSSSLSFVPIEDAPAWLVIDEKPLPATSLLFLTPDGTPVLADTPWTPRATRLLQRVFGSLD